MSFSDDERKLGVFPNRADWCNVMWFLVQKKKGMDNLDALEQLKMGGIKPNVVAYTLVLATEVDWFIRRMTDHENNLVKLPKVIDINRHMEPRNMESYYMPFGRSW
ncbi:hypothetical protein RHMOL_Rhmol11G0170600 [Rhododendron molle]|uniref:Uncharacterized protein n=1 Tax=Rhododendron molle TaxID=49168 RepID=A0ACC0LUU6_RHOML|nr:hypothetical protein RHMOL_Rhmol11G0170600 [Rhododendron molle]